MLIRRIALSLAALTAGAALCSAAIDGPVATGTISRNDPRVREIARMLPEKPGQLGRPISDRDAWAKAAKEIASDTLIRNAEAEIKRPMPDPSDELYLQCSKTGNRTNYQKPFFQIRRRQSLLTLAECIENKGRFIPELEKTVRRMCELPCWLYPAHDLSLTNFRQETFVVDLGVAHISCELATMLYFLGDKLSPEVRALTMKALHRRMIDPLLGRYIEGKSNAWWIEATHNWNSVCLAQTTAAALQVVNSREDRAVFVAAAEKFSQNSLQGFTDNGYCSEGLGYWSYGFGNYTRLADTLYIATDGKINIYDRPRVRATALYPLHLEIAPGIWPAYADCPPFASPEVRALTILNHRLGLHLDRYSAPVKLSAGVTAGDVALAAFDQKLPKMDTGPDLENQARFFFSHVGILTARPGPNYPKCRLAVSLKGGHNAEHHNHNDVGSFVTVAGVGRVTLDPGGEVYTRWTFSSRRYQSELLNSFGHPVPVVAGQLQRTGPRATARVVSHEFTDAQDTLTLDISRAYDVPELQKLERTFVYSREGLGSLEVRDEVRYFAPESFETALLTYGSWEKTGDDTLRIVNGESGLDVRIDTGGVPFTIEARDLKGHAQAGMAPTRIAIRLTQPVEAATVRLTMAALEPIRGEGGKLLRNGGFEDGLKSWKNRNDIASLSDEQAASGKHSLKIVDQNPKDGSNVFAARITVNGKGKYELRGKYYGVSGKGIGLYMNYRDAYGEGLNRDHRGWWVNVVGTLGGSEKQWKEFRFPFTTHPDTATIELWIHSASAAIVEGYIDDLEIVPVEE